MKDYLEIINSYRINDILDKYITLKRQGSNYISNCPFHVEKSPSLLISPSKGIYKCFGCGESGRSVNFVSKFLNIDFKDAIKDILEKLGHKYYEKNIDTIKIIKEVSNIANSNINQYIPKEYFLKRNISESSIKLFKLGYINKIEITDFQSYLHSDIIDNNGRSFLEKRIIFPISTATGTIVGFGAGVTEKKEGVPKYINSKESIFFNKSSLLYGLYQSIEHIKRLNSVNITEGYIDVITAHQNKINNTVASCGTAFTREHAYILSKLCDEFVFIFDGDLAGKKALIKAIENTLPFTDNIHAILLPKNEDLDSLLNKNIELPQKKHWFDIILNSIKTKEQTDKLLSFIKLIKSKNQAKYIEIFCDKFDVKKEDIISKFSDIDYPNILAYNILYGNDLPESISLVINHLDCYFSEYIIKNNIRLQDIFKLENNLLKSFILEIVNKFLNIPEITSNENIDNSIRKIYLINLKKIEEQIVVQIKSTTDDSELQRLSELQSKVLNEINNIENEK